jgi:predicted DNA-binding transcriptional regulator YafY
LDRIVDLQLTNQTFSDEKIDKKNFYNNVLGVTVAEGKPEKVVLQFVPMQGKYIKTMPIHHSQKIIKDTDKELRISLELVLNTELKMQLLSYGANVKVLQPKSLADEIKHTVKEMMNAYAE